MGERGGEYRVLLGKPEGTIDIRKNRRTQKKIFIISYTILLFVTQCK
jgi:hypothetical protein